MSLDKHRQAIDSIDAKIVGLLNERIDHVQAIGKIKHRDGGSIYAPHREKAVLDRVCEINKGLLPSESLRAVYREIMSAAISLEKPTTIAFLVLKRLIRIRQPSGNLVRALVTRH